MKKITVQINGMHCSSCARLIEGELADKVKSVKVSVVDKNAKIEFDEKKLKEKEILDIISELGYKPII
jgi:copper chaperone CopZ